MRSSRNGADYTRSHRLAAVEQFDVNPLQSYARSCQRFFHIFHEASRPANVHLRLSWNTDHVEDRSRQVADGVEILTHCVVRVRSAVANIAAAVSERQHEAVNFHGEWMM